MGRSSGACFKIIACGGGDSVDRDDLDASAESKGADKRGWSFRKRSARHRVLSNTVITETASGNKQSLESTAIGFQAPADLTVSEKTSEILWSGGAPRQSTSVNKAATVSTLGSETAPEDDTFVTETVTEDDILVPEGANEGATLVPEGANEGATLMPEGTNKGYTLVPDPAIEDESAVEVNPDEAATVIQDAVRRFLAQRALQKHKNAVKLQAAIRGHLVRRHAVGTLRCIHAITRMQALVRARLARRSAQGFATVDKLEENIEYDIMKLTGTENSGTKQPHTYISMEKLLRNAFARQLLKTPMTRHCFKLDPEKTASAWKWLDMWMAASAEIEQSSESESNVDDQEQDNSKHAENQMESAIPSQDSKPTTRKSDVEEATVPSQCKENLISHEETSNPTSHYMEQPQPVSTSLSTTNDSDLFLGDSSDSVSQGEHNSLLSEPQLEAKEPKRSMKRLAPEQADSDGRKFVFGSKKASNPAFIAAQSKFEVLTSTSNSAKSISSSNQEPRSESCGDAISSSHTDAITSSLTVAIKTKEVDQAENSVPHNSRVHVGGSDSGTELSISSTLDSPDRFEVANAEFEKESEVLVEEVGNPKGSNNIDQDKLEHTILGTELAYSISVPPDNHDSGIGANSGPSKPVTNEDVSQVECKLEETAHDAVIELELDTGHPVFKSSPDASPRSHMTVPESQRTPASQVSASTKKRRSDKKGSSQKRKSFSASKRSPINSGMDSGVRSSIEQLPKDHKTAKRRNSFGSPRPDHVEQEPRDSSSSNSLPSYMQATESARAKSLAANSSPRSSPDVHDKEIYIKKRHSLPGTNGRQGSPRIQRSMSQAQQSSKGTGTNERKWQR